MDWSSRSKHTQNIHFMIMSISHVNQEHAASTTGVKITVSVVGAMTTFHFSRDHNWHILITQTWYMWYLSVDWSQVMFSQWGPSNPTVHSFSKYRITLIPHITEDWDLTPASLYHVRLDRSLVTRLVLVPVRYKHSYLLTYLQTLSVAWIQTSQFNDGHGQPKPKSQSISSNNSV